MVVDEKTWLAIIKNAGEFGAGGNSKSVHVPGKSDNFPGFSNPNLAGGNGEGEKKTKTMNANFQSQESNLNSLRKTFSSISSNSSNNFKIRISDGDGFEFERTATGEREKKRINQKDCQRQRQSQRQPESYFWRNQNENDYVRGTGEEDDGDWRSWKKSKSKSKEDSDSDKETEKEVVCNQKRKLDPLIAFPPKKDGCYHLSNNFIGSQPGFPFQRQSRFSSISRNDAENPGQKCCKINSSSLEPKKVHFQKNASASGAGTILEKILELEKTLEKLKIASLAGNRKVVKNDNGIEDEDEMNDCDCLCNREKIGMRKNGPGDWPLMDLHLLPVSCPANSNSSARENGKMEEEEEGEEGINGNGIQNKSKCCSWRKSPSIHPRTNLSSCYRRENNVKNRGVGVTTDTNPSNDHGGGRSNNNKGKGNHRPPPPFFISEMEEKVGQLELVVESLKNVFSAFFLAKLSNKIKLKNDNANGLFVCKKGLKNN